MSTSLPIVLHGFKTFLHERAIEPSHVSITLTFKTHDAYCRWELFMCEWMAQMQIIPKSYEPPHQFTLMGIPIKTELDTSK